MTVLKKIFLFLILSTGFCHVYGQTAITGHINNPEGEGIFLANVAVKGKKLGTMTDRSGYYRLQLPAGEELSLVFSCVGYKSREMKIELGKGEIKELNIELETEVKEFDEVSVSARMEHATTLRRINIEDLQYAPTTTGSVESLIKTLPGVSSNNELSTQYSVRGGNYDENLIYVNDVEIYRPFLVRSGQQEGLSFINSDLISSLRFSAGGFDAMYGDKMSSVLDISYRDPQEFGGSASLSLLGGSLHLEGAGKNKKFSFLTGLRYKTTAYLLNSLEVEGEYNPQFSDFQALLRYKLNKNMEFSFLGNFGITRYDFVPVIQSTDFGTSQSPLNLTIFYEGNEMDRFDTYQGAFTFNYKPSAKVNLKLISSGFRTSELETFDILGQYLINELDNTVGSETYGDSILNIGIGSFLNHARNKLDAFVYSFKHTGEYNASRHKIKWGLKFENQIISDRLSEWSMVDSAGFSLPRGSENLELFDVIKAENSLTNSRISAYLQDTWGFSDFKNEYFLTAGVRTTYIALSDEFLVSPRAIFSLKPGWDLDMMFHASAGVYYQPPFYKEMRNPAGKVNRDIKSQRSIHYVLGGDYIFKSWERPFKFTTELYYKQLNNLIPYKVDNVRIRYAGENLAHGYAAGIDFKLNGEFVRGAESWVSLSFLKTEEDIEGDSYMYYPDDENQDPYLVYPGYYPRPADQLMNFGLYFQDYLPNYPDFKVHLSFLYGSKLPYSSPLRDRYDEVYRLPPYRRVDIGFSKVLKKSEKVLPEGNPFRHFNDIWISAEIFNLLGINNTISYLWVRTVSNQMGIPGIFAVPNYLTSRRYNLKLTMKF